MPGDIAIEIDALHQIHLPPGHGADALGVGAVKPRLAFHQALADPDGSVHAAHLPEALRDQRRRLAVVRCCRDRSGRYTPMAHL